MTVLDASAVLALVHDEPGAETVAEALASAHLGAANLAEVIGTLVDADVDVSRVRGLLTAAGVVIEVDLFSARGPLPGDLIEAEARRKDITYSSRTRLNTDIFKHKHALRRAIVALYEALPPDAQKQDWARALRELGSDHAVAIVHLIYGSRPYEGQTMDFDFSRLSMEEHWQAGLDDARRTLRQPRWLEDWDAATALRVFDIARGGG